MKKKKILALCLSIAMLLVCFPVRATTPSAFETSSWTSAGIGYLLYMISDEYPPSTQETTIVQKLLNLETASDTLKELFGEEFGK